MVCAANFGVEMLTSTSAPVPFSFTIWESIEGSVVSKQAKFLVHGYSLVTSDWRGRVYDACAFAKSVTEATENCRRPCTTPAMAASRLLRMGCPRQVGRYLIAVLRPVA